MLFSITREFTTPFQQQGPGRDPLAAAIAIQGCFILGKAAADLSASRAMIQLDLLSCVWPDGDTYERPIRGYATDKDGTLGIVGRVETHTSAVVAKAALVGMMQEASAAFGLARSAVIVTQTGGGAQPFQGAQTIIQQLGQFYLEQARQLLPTLWVQAGVDARLVLQEGLALEGLPTHLPLQAGGH
jgi:conjugal transfer pilus assembly protein TraB